MTVLPPTRVGSYPTFSPFPVRKQDVIFCYTCCLDTLQYQSPEVIGVHYPVLPSIPHIHRNDLLRPFQGNNR